MGKKSNRFVNPADQQRKQDRKRELKRNKKQRTETRESIVKSKDPEEIIDQLRHVDEQIYDPDKAGKENLQIKRKKTLASFYSILSYVRAQKDTTRAKELQNLIDSYENERKLMEEKYNAVIFARDGNLDIPLPMGFASAEDAMTPASMIPIPPPAPKIHHGILKKPVERRLRKVPPGPPCVPPPEYDDFGDVSNSQVSQISNTKRVKINEIAQDTFEDNYDPVEIPLEIHNGDMPSLSQMFPSIMSIPIHPPQIQMPHLPVPPIMNRQNPNSIISAPAQVSSAAVGPSQPVIAAGPQMRDLWKETTRFVPTNVQLNKNPMKPRRTISYANPVVTTKPKAAVKESPKKTEKEKSKDEVCDDFLASLGDLL